jgi:thiosulfate dehydrogenase [quinone] large subunit
MDFTSDVKRGPKSITREVTTIDDPPFARTVFGSTRFAGVWLIVRLYVGWAFLSEGIMKATTPAWTGAQAGTYLTKFVMTALAKTTGAHPDVQGWYAAFLRDVVLPHTALWSYAVTGGEIAVGLGLIAGAFTGIAAFFAMVMNGSYLLAGAVSINPILFSLGILLVLGWKAAGWWGFDRYLLPRLRTPWRSPKRAITSVTAPDQPWRRAS